MAEVLSVVTAVPSHVLERPDTIALLPVLAGGESQALRFRATVDHARIDSRHLVAPVADLLAQSGPEQRARHYEQHARALALPVAQTALRTAGVSGAAVDLVISVSCTGYMLPSVDAYLMAALGITNHARRLPITELGCAAGVAALGLAGERAGTGVTLIVSVELCSTCLQTRDLTTTDVIGNLLFADGAAAAVVHANDTGEGPEILATRSVLWPDTTELLGMRLTDTGLRLVLSPDLPVAVRRHLPDTVAAFLADHGVPSGALSFWIVHPGGPKVLEAVGIALRLDAAALRPSWTAWGRYGNISSATVFAIIEALRDLAPPVEGALGLMLAFGPGLSCEMILLRARGWLCRPRT